MRTRSGGKLRRAMRCAVDQQVSLVSGVSEPTRALASQNRTVPHVSDARLRSRRPRCRQGNFTGDLTASASVSAHSLTRCCIQSHVSLFFSTLAASQPLVSSQSRRRALLLMQQLLFCSTALLGSALNCSSGLDSRPAALPLVA